MMYGHLGSEIFFQAEDGVRDLVRSRGLGDVYKRQVWKNVSNPLILKNSKNNPIFHLIFASNNSTGLKIANYIIDKNSPKNI